MIQSVLAISAGASAGAVLRWLLALALNPVLPLLPLGTLTANLIGGFLMGIALCVFAAHSSLPVEWALLFVTGFLGALTTFSTFSAEVSMMLVEQRLWHAAATVALHVCGSLLMTFLGMGAFKLVAKILH
ncbi:fluoride efflux transporter CrcB [Desulfovibrio sp. OttesenSCG-928-C06]|nr:fluoride efflux transporter CrcB [Desulfovibrio sp. OttesenSCG-928-C06]